MAVSPPPTLQLKVERGKANKSEFRFDGPFRLGRDPSCQVRLHDAEVSRQHAELRLVQGQWWIYDLKSMNGTLLDGQRVDRAMVPAMARLQLGQGGPILLLTLPDAAKEEQAAPRGTSVTQYKRHYFEDDRRDNVGHHTMVIRNIYRQLQRRQRRHFQWIIGVMACLLLVAGGYGYYKHREVEKQRALAENVFYAMKSMELEFADLLRTARQTHDTQYLAYVNKYRLRRKEMEKNYEEFLKGLNIYAQAKNPQERAILSVARAFGECEVSMPRDFVKEVLAYVEKWKSTGRYQQAIELARSNGYIGPIVAALCAQDLPPQFLYLALQESSFNKDACGPPTRYGIAKGIWQFIPTTARNYGLHTGPLVDLPQPDPEDERHDFLKSTRAAAEYLRHIYDTDAQASGLLVMASYNWGENRVIKLIRTMPKDPKSRNFWRLLNQYGEKIPKETHDYVFYIFSAAVIGENPRLFGFDFDNPMSRFTGLPHPLSIAYGMRKPGNRETAMGVLKQCR